MELTIISPTKNSKRKARISRNSLKVHPSGKGLSDIIVGESIVYETINYASESIV